MKSRFIIGLAGCVVATVAVLIGVTAWVKSPSAPETASDRAARVPALKSRTAPTAPRALTERRSTPDRPPADLPPDAGPGPVLDPRIHRIASKQVDGTYSLPEIAEVNSKLNSSEGTVETDIAIVRTLIFLYSHFNDGAVPQGAYNEEITAKLRGENPKRFSVLPPDNASNFLNARGELLDRWGTPYFLHPMSSQLIEIRSAGPDRKLWTKDDVQVSSEEDRNDGAW